MRVITQSRAINHAAIGRASYEDGSAPRQPRPEPAPVDPQEKLLLGLQQVLAQVVENSAKTTADVCAALVQARPAESPSAEEWNFAVTHTDSGRIANVSAVLAQNASGPPASAEKWNFAVAHTDGGLIKNVRATRAR